MAASTELGAASAPGAVGPPEPVAVASGWNRHLQLPRSPKVIFGLISLGFFLLIAVIGPWIAPYPPGASLSTTNGVPQPPSAAHWLGTTQVQQDVLSQLLVGARSMVLVAFLSGAVATVLSVVIGVTAGYLGGYADDLLSMLANFFLVLPALPLLIVIFGFLPPSQGSNDLLIGLIIAITGWAWGARVLRAQTLSMRSRDYVDSARLAGERTWRIIGFEILPNLTADRRLVAPVHRAVRGRHLHRHGLPGPGQPDALELGHDALLGAERQRRGQRVLVVVAAARPRRGLPRYRTGPAQLRHRRVHQPPAAGAGLTRKRVRRYAVGTVPRQIKLGVTPVVQLREEGQQP